MTRDEVFAAMEQAYRGQGSTRDGTFAGDILRACADGCAELYSTEIDGLERRAFVTTAAGEWLTKVCADRGVERRAGEEDDALRARTLESLQRQGASGNADDYESWCAAVPEILRVRVLPLHRGAGTVDIAAVGLDGRGASAAAVAAAQAMVDEKRPVGADARVLAASETAVHVTAKVALADGGDLTAVQAAFSAALAEFCRDCALTVRVVSFARVSALLLGCGGVADVADLRLNGGTESLNLTETAAPVPGTVTLTEVES